MKLKKTYRLGYSGCPNDTFIFKAIARRLIDLHGYAFDIVIEDVETLNQKAAKGAYVGSSKCLPGREIANGLGKGARALERPL